MKLLYVFSVYLPLTGGWRILSARVSPYLTSQGHEVHVLTKRWPSNLKG
jgi:hypothetical protein